MATKYKIETLADMARIPAEAVPRFMIELPDILASIRMMQDVVKAAGGELGVSIPGAVWLDDNERNFAISLECNGEEILSVKGTHAPKGTEA